MIPVRRPAAPPEGFVSRCTERGGTWLAKHPLDADGQGPEPTDYWSEFEPQLREVFQGRCGWLAMWIPEGQIDHYRSKHHPDRARRVAQRPQAYDWDNLRYADASVNNRKRNHDEAVLDPYEVGDGWFALDAALELTITEACPVAERPRAAFTISTLDLSKGRVATRLREKFLKHYEQAVASGMASESALAQLDADAPLLAAYLRVPPAHGAP